MGLVSFLRCDPATPSMAFASADEMHPVHYTARAGRASPTAAHNEQLLGIRSRIEGVRQFAYCIRGIVGGKNYEPCGVRVPNFSISGRMAKREFLNESHTKAHNC
jgi:hypothetical protein